MDNFLSVLRKKTEAFLTWRKRRKLIKREKLRRKNVVADWVEAFLSAVVIVFFINQYILQAYQIPTGSMIATLMEGDRIFVDKLSYGPELLPGLFKLPGLKKIERAEIAIFESPEYESKGTLTDIITRIVYMMTFSLVDLDRDEYGNPAKHFLIKRVMGVPGDLLRMRKGLLQIRPEGEQEWYKEDALKEKMKLNYNLNKRFYSERDYSLFELAAPLTVFHEESIPYSQETKEKVDDLIFLGTNNEGKNVWGPSKNLDFTYVDMVRFRTKSEIRPYDTVNKREWRKNHIGRFIPPGSIFPMGDNRDDSRDARFFGPVMKKKVLGKSLFRFWPLNRFGGIR
ncbi:MAG: signal peptidase I [Spirochaetales bacterium]|nr:signal peptidase I [Spirochaetales bacterium]